MNKVKRLLACGLAITMAFGMTACDESTPASSGGNSSGASNQVNQPGAVTTTTSASTTTDPNDALDMTDKKEKTFDTSLYQPSGNAGTVKFCAFYDIQGDQKGTEQCMIFNSDLFGGNIEYIATPTTTDALLEKLSNLIASDDSPDLVEKTAMRYPGNISKNMFEALDGKIDIDSPLWSDMKDIAESYAWNNKHYYYPHRITTSFSLNYSKKTIEENDLPDPYELYKNGEWTWDAWRDMMTKFCDKDENNIGFYGTDTTVDAFILTTGTSLIDTQPNGSITNNLANPNVTRAMQFIEGLCRDGVTYGKELGNWVPPETFATECDRLLFLCMEPEWTYTAATEELQNPKGVENDIFDTVSEFAFVPFPRDPQADAYYQGYDTFGFLVPKGAKNMDGALEFINLFRAYDVDPVIQAQVKNDHIAPEKIYFEKGSNVGKEKWQITWGEQEYDLWREMCDPANFSFINEDAYGFTSDLQSQLATVVMDVVENGSSWTQTSTEISPIVDSTIAEYALS